MQEFRTNPSQKARKERAFKEAWKKEFDWLVYDKEAGKMFCQYCLDFPISKNKLSSFFVGSKNFQLTVLFVKARYKLWDQLSFL